MAKAGRVIGVAAIAAAAAVLAPGAAHGKTTIVNAVPGVFTSVQADGDNLFQFVEPAPRAPRCPRNASALTAGWAGSGAFIGEIDIIQASPIGIWDYELRRSNFAGRNRVLGLCVRGTRTIAKQVSGTTISCGRNIAIGLPLYTGSPFQEGAAGSYPLGINRWRTTIEDRGAKTLCVPRRAFRSVRTVKKTGIIRKGRVSARVAATCPARHRAIGWGYQFAPVPGFTPPRFDPRNVPFISASFPLGARRWVLQFTTPTGERATGNTRVITHAVCGVPA